MKRLVKLAISSLTLVSLFSGCAQQPVQQIVPLNNNISANTIENKYIITARALIDKMPKAKPADRLKILKDFERELKSLNRYALESLVRYSMEVLYANLKPGEDPMEAPIMSMVQSLQGRLLNVYQGFSKGVSQVFAIAIEKDTNLQEKMLQDFGKYVKKMAKVDLKNLLKVVNGESGNMGDYLKPESPLAKRLIKMIEDRLAQ